jgi:hypothetical protein
MVAFFSGVLSFEGTTVGTETHHTPNGAESGTYRQKTFCTHAVLE